MQAGVLQSAYHWEIAMPTATSPLKRMEEVEKLLDAEGKLFPLSVSSPLQCRSKLR
jgi:hypothetical protein